MSDDLDDFCATFGTMTTEGSVAWNYYDARAKELMLQKAQKELEILKKKHSL